VAAFGVEYVLELREPRDVAPELGARRALVGVLAGVGGVDPIEADAGAGRDAMMGRRSGLYPPAVQ